MTLRQLEAALAKRAKMMPGQRAWRWLFPRWDTAALLVTDNDLQSQLGPLTWGGLGGCGALSPPLHLAKRKGPHFDAACHGHGACMSLPHPAYSDSAITLGLTR